MDKNKDKKNLNVGGVSLFDGILFSSKYRQAIVQKSKSNVVTGYSREYSGKKKLIEYIPILRGLAGIISQVSGAAPVFIESADEEVDNSIKNNTLFSYIILLVVLIGLPILLSLLVSYKYRGIVQAIVVFLEFILYLSMLNISPDLNSVFMYHGAEHKAVNAFEKLDIKDITLENVKKQSRYHKRCGGNFVVYYIVLMILSCIFIPNDNMIFKTILLILSAVLNIGISYEIVFIFSVLPVPLDIINYPATLIQRITTKEPTDDMLKLAIYGVTSVARERNGISVKDYIEKYLMENNIYIKDKEIDKKDILKIIESIANIDIGKLTVEQENTFISLHKEIKIDIALDRYYKEDIPLQYITNKQAFFREIYYINENVLIPRSDTEILVEKAIEYIEKEEIKSVIDLCTGSGCIGISIAKNSNVDKVEELDISAKALNVARRNIYSNNVIEKVITVCSDLLAEKINSILNNGEDRVDMIVSNPPYIKSNIIKTLNKNVQNEPHIALDGGEDGLDMYIRIFKEAKEVLKDNGLLLLEIGYDQLEDIKNIIKTNNEYELLESIKDYGGNDRVVICRFHQK